MKKGWRQVNIRTQNIVSQALPNDFSVQSIQNGGWPFAAHGPPAAIPELPDVQFQFCNRTTQGIAMHTQFTRRFALIAFVLRENIHNKAFLELPNRF